MKWLRIACFVFFVLFSTHCSRAETTRSANYLITGSADGAPPGCSPEVIAERLSEMFAAVNRGDLDMVLEYFGQKNNAPFQWYSMTELGATEAEKRHFVAYNWDDLTTYFKERYQQHEHLDLVSLHVNLWDSERGLVHFGPVVVTRQADDLLPGMGGPDRIAEGKGAYHCETSAFIVLSFAMVYEPQ